MLVASATHVTGARRLFAYWTQYDPPVDVGNEMTGKPAEERCAVGVGTGAATTTVTVAVELPPLLSHA